MAEVFIMVQNDDGISLEVRRITKSDVILFEELTPILDDAVADIRMLIDTGGKRRQHSIGIEDTV